MADGFFLELHDYCSRCGDFEPHVEKTEVTSFEEEANSHMTTISCENADKCARIAENLKKRFE